MTNKELEAKVRELEEENQRLKTMTDGSNAPLTLPDPAKTPLIPFVETEYETVKLFRDEYRYKDPLYVSINGKNWVIVRGEPVKLPKYVAKFIEQQMATEAAIWERVAKEEKDYLDMTAMLK